MSQNIKERPILMNGPMVRAVLNGSKTQTRRLVKPQPTHFNPAGMPRRAHLDGASDMIPCPYGNPGDRLWVREAWAPHPQDANFTFYRATVEAEPGFPVWSGPWVPSIHMPRRASRIALEITGVRVERLTEISEDDAIAEGIAPLPNHPGRWWLGFDVSSLNYPSARNAFIDLWKHINGPGSWDLNPWVWVIEFKRVDGNKP